MPTPHKHRDVIIAWANGETIQWKDEYVRNWTDWVAEHAPTFGSRTEYRIKPKTLVRYMAVLELHGKLYSSNLYETLDGCKALPFQRSSNTIYHRVVLEGSTIVSCEEVK